MRVEFIFAEVDEASELNVANHLKFPFIFSDTGSQPEDFRSQIMDMAYLIGELTEAAVFVTCKEVGLKKTRVKLAGPERQSMTPQVGILIFDGQIVNKRRKQSRKLKIGFPVVPPASMRGPHRWVRSQSISRTDQNPNSQDEFDLRMKYVQLSEIALGLLNSDQDENWTLRAFHPAFWDNSLVKKLNNRFRRLEKQEKKKERAANAKQKAQSKGKPHPDTGAGRSFGAVPGVFMGVQMRSQLEIRLAAELQERGIEWVYERERLGEGNYLVDFHLPQLGIWVEVKGKVEARDKYLLKDFAQHLASEREEQLVMYTSRRAYKVTPDAFGEGMKHADFWEWIESQKG